MTPSGLSPRKTRETPRTTRRIGSSPFSSARNSSPVLLVRKYQRLRMAMCSPSSAAEILGGGGGLRAVLACSEVPPFEGGDVLAGFGAGICRRRRRGGQRLLDARFHRLR